jgi:hypothetical protein
MWCGPEGRLTPADTLRDCFESRPFTNRRPPRGKPGLRAPDPTKRSDELLRRPGDLPEISLPSLDFNLIIPEIRRRPILTNNAPVRTGRVFLFANNSGTLAPEKMLGAGAPHPTEPGAFIGVSQKKANFNGHGFSDLVVGAVRKAPAGSAVRSGLAEVFVGGPNGLSFVGELSIAGLAPPFDGDDLGYSMDQ